MLCYSTIFLVFAENTLFALSLLNKYKAKEEEAERICLTVIVLEDHNVY